MFFVLFLYCDIHNYSVFCLCYGSFKQWIFTLYIAVYNFQIMYLYYLLGWKGYVVKNPQKITVRLFCFLCKMYISILTVFR